MDERTEELKKDFPTLSSQADHIGMRMVAYIEMKMNDCIKSNRPIPKEIVEMYKTLTDNLGISGNKRKAVGEQIKEGTIDQLHRIYKQTKEVYPQLEEKIGREEVALLWQALNNKEITRQTFDALISRLGYHFKNDNEIVQFINNE